MTQFVQYILAILLAIISPGQSTYSRVAITNCDETCQQTLLCSNPNDWRCKAPQFSQQLYEANLQLLKDNGLSADQAAAKARLKAFTRPETYEEGLARYTIIAQAIADVSEETNRHVCKQKCDQTSQASHNVCGKNTSCSVDADNAAKSCHQACVKNAPWIWKRSDLAIMLATITNQESGFRADVHGGVGSLGRGDCQWQYTNGRKARPFAKGAKPITSTCRSVCLGQINIGNGTTPGGLKADDLVGVDYNSTKRCLTVVAKYLARSRNMCTRWNKTPGDWAKATFAAYGTGASCVSYQKKTVKGISQYAYRVKKPDGKLGVAWGAFPPDNAINKNPLEAGWPSKRSGIFHAYARMYTKNKLSLPQDVQNLLAEPYMNDGIQKLMASPTAINWMIPIVKKPAAHTQSKLQAGPNYLNIETANR